MVNRVSAYLGSGKKPSSGSGVLKGTFDDFMVKCLADTLQRMLKSGLANKQELIDMYSSQRFSVDAPLYRNRLRLYGTDVTPRAVFRADYRNLTGLREEIYGNLELADQEQTDEFAQWAMVMEAFSSADYFIVWRMAQMFEDIEDSVGIYGAFCRGEVLDQEVEFSTQVTGVVLQPQMDKLLRSGSIKHVGELSSRSL
jgi:hypothetical protein